MSLIFLEYGRHHIDQGHEAVLQAGKHTLQLAHALFKRGGIGVHGNRRAAAPRHRRAQLRVILLEIAYILPELLHLLGIKADEAGGQERFGVDAAVEIFEVRGAGAVDALAGDSKLSARDADATWSARKITARPKRLLLQGPKRCASYVNVVIIYNSCTPAYLTTRPLVMPGGGDNNRP